MGYVQKKMLKIIQFSNEVAKNSYLLYYVAFYSFKCFKYLSNSSAS